MQLYVLNIAALAGAAVLLWLGSLPLRDASIVDRFWGLYFVLVAGVTFVFAGPSDHGIVLVILTAVWGLRLAAYLTWRNWGGGEDYRYQKMRRYWGKRFSTVSLFSVFLLQAGLAWIISLPLQRGIGSAGEEPLGGLGYAGIAIWTIGLVFESAGDWQLARFKADPANDGKVMDRGLWRYTRHPNYFGDAVVWWGLFLVSLSASGAWWTVVGPALMTFLLMRVSGVPMLEKKLKKSRPEYEDYAARTSSFVPWPPKKLP